MPAQRFSLQNITERLFAYWVEGEPLPDPPVGSTAGLSDSELWTLMRTDDDVLQGMGFDEAVAQDPRRIDALIQQRIYNDFYSVLDLIRGEQADTLARWYYLQGVDSLREQTGEVTAVGLAAMYAHTWELYSRILDVSVQMRRDDVPAERMWDRLVQEAASIRRGFRTAYETAERASRVAPDPDEQGAWRQIMAVVRDMDEAFINKIGELGHTAPEQFGADPAYKAMFNKMGHRAPHPGVSQYRRMGGRFY